MIRTYKVDKKQNLVDICLQIYGSTQQLFKLAKDNGISIDADVTKGQELSYDTTFGDFKILKRITSNGLRMINPKVSDVAPGLLLINDSGGYLLINATDKLEING